MFSIAPTILLSAVAIGYVSASPAPATITVLAPVPQGTIVTASILGVDQAGHTTYAIDQPIVEGLGNGVSTTVTHFTATLVAGSDYASETLSISYSDPNMKVKEVAGAECTLSGQKAICNDGSASTLTTDAAFVTASLTQVMDVVGASGSGSGSGSGASESGPQPTSGAAAGRSAFSMSAVAVGAAFALLGSILVL
ncbi:hypothetical protein HMN09_01077700 [Mycena chlorophos]|uniref:GPI anchored protein n=1 Tax=Mycena chlorophos TaxID=658473 RepID=A0A8H6SC48_MYCCL|nr:hypothetical protein HMN09_01077700 [Mycena chlorophos]